ncbi:hypothetical protein HGRIS_001350 [Hohenbuehelia grisea]|uniref:Uncharacterized protein n=1 Tax=Hohenbuehelia grisea TaxID=104357 RepID=A0ABR3JQX8_9AGAR
MDGRRFEGPHEDTGFLYVTTMSLTLHKVYLAAIAGHVPDKMGQCLAAFLDFYYLARKNALRVADLQAMEASLALFHGLRDIFIHTGVRDTISLPRQHSLKHYPRSIRLFGSPNGLCSSITESKHIQAVKELWRRSNRYNALSQMLKTLSRLDIAHQTRSRIPIPGLGPLAKRDAPPSAGYISLLLYISSLSPCPMGSDDCP